MDKLNELPSGWQWAKLGDVCDIVSGSTPNTNVSEYWDGEISWITPTDLGKLTDSAINFSQRKITEKGFKSCSVRKIPTNSVVMSSRAPIGHLAINNIECCTNQGCKSFIPSSDVDTFYLYFALKINVGEFQRLGTGSTFAEISKTTLANFEIPLPPLPEQQRLAKILTEKLALVEQAKQKIEAQVEAAEQLTAAYLREVFESDEAKGWKLVKLGDVCSFENGDRGENYPSKAVQTSTGIPFINAGHLTDFGIDFTKMNYIPKDRFDLLGSGKIRKNDILFCLRGSLGKFASVGDLSEGAIASSLIIIRPKECVLNEFVLAYLQSDLCIKMIDDFRNGAAQPNLSGENLKNFKIPLLSIEKQKELATYLSEKIAIVQQLKTTLLAQLENVNQIPSALLKQAFNGEL